MKQLILSFLSLSFLSLNVLTDDNGLPIREFRGAWIATVTNLDWPNSRNDTPDAQKQQLIDMLDELHAAGINTVMFQIRTECDALYYSPYEPWSYWLTGEQGKAPDPFYDPLEFAIEEAHKRGLEIHAWFNPYRAERSVGDYNLSDEHVTVQNPDWALTIGSIKIIDPGLPEVREFVSKIVADVVRRYDVDGVHFDDYFYPYPPNQISNEDEDTFAEHDRGFTDIGEWRRDNVNLLIEAVHDSINAIKPHVKFGMSPFGIWKNGVPQGISGLDAYNVIFADPVAWMEAETIDYIVPQLYWAFGGGQDYALLAPWWGSVRNNRHYYPGLGLYKSDSNTFSGALYAANEIPRQVRFNREYEGISGSVFFRAKNITVFNSKGITDSLKQDLFRYPAIVPSIDWKDSLYAPLAAPGNLRYTRVEDHSLHLEWDAPPPPEFGDDLIRYAVYRDPVVALPAKASGFDNPANLIAITANPEFLDSPPLDHDGYYYYVTALNRNHNESDLSEGLLFNVTSVDDDLIAGSYSLHQNYPNPFNPATVIQFSIPTAQQVSLKVYDMLGREVAVVVDSFLAGGEHRVEFNASHLSSGMYIYRIKAGEFVQSKRMMLVR